MCEVKLIISNMLVINRVDRHACDQGATVVLVGPQEPLDRADTEVYTDCSSLSFLHRLTAVGMTKDDFTPFATFRECGAILLGPLFLDSLPWKLQVGSKYTRPVDIWGWQDLGILASRTG